MRAKGGVWAELGVRLRRRGPCWDGCFWAEMKGALSEWKWARMGAAHTRELCEMSDRVLVMRSGRVVAELTGDRITQENVLRHALSEVA